MDPGKGSTLLVWNWEHKSLNQMELLVDWDLTQLSQSKIGSDMSVWDWKLKQVSFEKNCVCFEFWTKAGQLRSTEMEITETQVVRETCQFHSKNKSTRKTVNFDFFLLKIIIEDAKVIMELYICKRAYLCDNGTKIWKKHSLLMGELKLFFAWTHF